MNEEALQQEIEIARRKLNELAESKSLLSDEMVELSRTLDHLLNQYEQIHRAEQSLP
ncbi:aspartyl-phosphate phosphatase Spo0E family protein [Salsuginibacillus kocurii]|uniref:aspartyl-phosphate phosphatase Spo0E family protein n=1 Tax=Salsuginibacillus kocurii TaxID=427078 RepID=UPI00035D07DD|nr:aspartyl-phosphate phosphatase Spo0E family protein [Salsuginibacillus kocurii]